MAGMETAARDRIAADEQERLNRLARAWTAYHEQLPPTLKPLKDGTRDDVPVQFARFVVDTSVHFLYGKGVEFIVPGGTDEDQAWVDRLWRENRGRTTMLKFGQNGSVGGHCFAKIKPSTTPGGFPRIIVLDPANCTIETAPDDIDEVVRYIYQFTTVNASGRPVVRRQTIEQDGNVWRIVDEESALDSQAWTTISEELWAWPFPPIVDWQNTPIANEIYGKEDLTSAVIDLSQSIRFSLSNMQRIIRLHAHPKQVATGFQPGDVQIGPDGMIVLPKDASVALLEMQSELSSSLAFSDRLVEHLHVQSGVPDVATGKLQAVGQLSGVALQILFQPVLQKNGAKQSTHGDGLNELTRRCMVVAGRRDLLPETVWPDALPKDSLTSAQTALAWQEAGVSVATTIESNGYDPDTEADRRADEARASEDAFDEGLPPVA